MSKNANLGALAPGMAVYDVNGEPLGPIESTSTSGIHVLGQSVPAAAIARVDGDGVRLLLGRAAFETLPPVTSGANQETRRTAQTAAGEGERVTVPLVEERLVVDTRERQIGEVAIEKRVVEEQIMVPVTIRREEIEIIRRAPGEPREEIDDPSVVDVIRIPLRGEEPVITKEAVVTREVVINREMQAHTDKIVDTVRSTEVIVEENLDAVYDRLRPNFESHFTAEQEARRGAGGATYRARDFRDAEANYRAGFTAGRDARYTGRSFEEIEPELLHAANPADGDANVAAQVRAETREGFARARALQIGRPR